MRSGSRKREPQPGTDAGTGTRTEAGTEVGTTTGIAVFPRGFPNREPGGGWGSQGEGGEKWRSIEGEKRDMKQEKQRSEYFAPWRTNDFAP